MIFAVEWYDVPRKNYGDLVQYHPYLTKGDLDKLYYVNMQHYIEHTGTLILFSIVSGKFLGRRPFFSKPFVKWPSSLLAGALSTYAFHLFFLREIYRSDLVEL